MIVQQDLLSLTTAATYAGFQVNINHLQLLNWIAGANTHIPLALPHGFNAVYVFSHGNTCLKVGKACGANAKTRYQTQHYYVKAPSTLARSLQNDNFYSPLIGELTIREWIINNTNRYNILIPDHYNKYFVHFVEAFFILKCNPRFEGKI
jgi:hypothetical protein